MLAAYPEWQAWIHAELDVVFAGHSDPLTLDYESCYPRLKRCQALMYETLRLYSPVLFVPKWTGPNTQTIKYAGREIFIPPMTMVSPNVVGLQTHPNYWVDPLAYTPSRYMTAPGAPSPTPTAAISAADLEAESPDFVQVKGSYCAWSDGPRVCPGKKFSQVEFVSVLSTMLWKHKIEVEPRKGESFADVQKRVLDVVADSYTTFTLQMRNPQSVGIKIVKR